VIESERVDTAFARKVRVAQILHPSPASPAANRGWSEAVDRTLAGLGVLAREEGAV
jgi:single-strand selective monofunctional uracil DNA glycosylase